MSSKDADKKRIMHSKNYNTEILIGKERYKIITELFESLLFRYRIGLQELMKDSDLVFDYIDLLLGKFHKISLSDAGSYIDSPDLVKRKSFEKS